MSGRRRCDERGAATAFVVGMAAILLACAGLVVDGGSALNARSTLADDVEQAARAGAQMLDQDYLRSGNAVRIDAGAATARAQQYVAERGYTNAGVVVTDDTVTVRATDTVATKLLNLIGIRTFDIEATATAEAVTQ